jgi:hypothetical protein
MALNKKYAYYVDRDNIAIVEDTSETIDTYESKWSTVSTTGLTFKVYGSEIPDDMSADGVGTEIPTIHNIQEYILNYLIAEGYQDPRNLVPQIAQQFLAKAKFFERQAKKEIRRRKQRGGFIKPVDY